MIRHAARVAVLAGAAWAFMAHAATLQIGPIPVEVVAPAATATLLLTNRSTDAGTFQVRAMRWTQKDGQESLEPTEALLASPPIVTIAPAAEQTIRLVRPGGKRVEQEETYRIWIDEVVPQDAAEEGMNLKIAMRYSVPVFFEPAGILLSPPKPLWSLKREPGKDWVLSCRNEGRQRLRLSNLSLKAGDKPAFFPFKEGVLIGYALAGETASWSFAPPADGSLPANAPLELTVQSQLGELRGSLPVAAAP